jgi:hypothetical protein
MRSISVLELTSDRDATVIGSSEFCKVTCCLCRILARRLRRNRDHLLSAIALFYIDHQNLLKSPHCHCLAKSARLRSRNAENNIAPVQLTRCHKSIFRKVSKPVLDDEHRADFPVGLLLTVLMNMRPCRASRRSRYIESIPRTNRIDTGRV